MILSRDFDRLAPIIYYYLRSKTEVLFSFSFISLLSFAEINLYLHKYLVGTCWLHGTVEGGRALLENTMKRAIF